MKYEPYHDEILAAFEPLADRRLGNAIQRDRRSSLEYLGIRMPVLRKTVLAGFSFYDREPREVLDIWDDLWNGSPYGEVLLGALEYYRARIEQATTPSWWPVFEGWSQRIENWAHADGLSGLYSYLLEANPRLVYPQLKTWNRADSEWLRRISLVSSIHYTGENAVFLPPTKVFPLVTRCLSDDRYYVQKAVGWVLREMGRVYQEQCDDYLKRHGARMSAIAFSRAIEKRSPEAKTELRRLRKATAD